MKNNLTPSSLPPRKEKSSYKTLMQNNFTNQISRVNSKRNTSKRITGQQVINSEGLTVVTKEVIKLGVPEAQMIDFFNVTFSQLSNHENIRDFTFTLAEYMEVRGLKDAKSARNQLKTRMDTLATTTYKYSSTNTKNPYDQSFGAGTLLSYQYKRGKVEVSLSRPFHDVLIYQSMPMPYYMETLKLDPKRDATAYLLARALQYNKRMNPNSPRGNRIKIPTLLNHLTNLPTCEEVQNSNRNFTNRIIEPITNAMDKLVQIGMLKDACFLDGNNQILNEVDADIDFEDYLKYTLEVVWNNYPDEEPKKWSDTKKKKREQRKKKKGKTKKTN